MDKNRFVEVTLQSIVFSIPIWIVFISSITILNKMEYIWFIQITCVMMLIIGYIGSYINARNTIWSDLI